MCDAPGLSPAGQYEFAGLGRMRPSWQREYSGHFGRVACGFLRFQCRQQSMDRGEPKRRRDGIDQESEAAGPRACRIAAQLEAGGVAVVAVGDECLPYGQTTDQTGEFRGVVTGPQYVGDLSGPGDGDRRSAGGVVHELCGRRLCASVGQQQRLQLGAQP
ncbi:hypothetical protein GCM10023097_74530 [Streptomyces collinus]